MRQFPTAIFNNICNRVLVLRACARNAAVGQIAARRRGRVGWDEAGLCQRTKYAGALEAFARGSRFSQSSRRVS